MNDKINKLLFVLFWILLLIIFLLFIIYKLQVYQQNFDKECIQNIERNWNKQKNVNDSICNFYLIQSLERTLEKNREYFNELDLDIYYNNFFDSSLEKDMVIKDFCFNILMKSQINNYCKYKFEWNKEFNKNYLEKQIKILNHQINQLDSKKELLNKFENELNKLNTN